MRLTTSAVLGVLALAGCDSSYHVPPHAPSVEQKKIPIVSKKPDGPYRTTASLEAYGGTKERTKQKLLRDAEKQGCDVLLLTSEDQDTFEDPKEGTIKRQILRADCLVRSE